MAMNAELQSARFMAGRQLTWAVWLLALAGYTYLLVVPNEWLPPWLRTTVGTPITTEFTLGKLAHAMSYATLTAATFLLPVGWPAWAICVAGLSLHGMGTEFVQTFTGRHGCWADVGTDHVGIVVGLLLGGLGYRIWVGRRTGGGADRKAAPPQVQQYAGGKNADADPL
jgi:VanZ family protein